MNRLRFYDCNCSVGKKVAPPLWSAQSPREILKQMDYCGIESAFAYHNACVDYHPLAGNAEILRVSEKEPRIRPVFVVMPNQTGEFMEPDILAAHMKQNGVKMARLFPKYNFHSFSLSDWQCGELFDRLEKNGITVLIDLEQTDWETIYRVCAAHPEMSLVVTNIYYRNYRYASALLQKLTNLYIDSSGLKINNGLDELVRIAGAERILFGTDAGNLSAGAAVCIVTYSAISDREKELIASGNLRRLLGLGDKR